MGLFNRNSSDEIYDGSATVESGFAPRGDGEYRAGTYVLRFTRPLVTETDSTDQGIATGEFTDGPRFTVQRAFSRPVVYTALTLDAEGAPLRVRRTDTTTRETVELDLTFDSDVA